MKSKIRYYANICSKKFSIQRFIRFFRTKVANGGSTTLINEVANDLSAKLNDSCRLRRQGSISPTGTCGKIYLRNLIPNSVELPTC